MIVSASPPPSLKPTAAQNASSTVRRRAVLGCVSNRTALIECLPPLQDLGSRSGIGVRAVSRGRIASACCRPRAVLRLDEVAARKRSRTISAPSRVAYGRGRADVRPRCGQDVLDCAQRLPGQIAAAWQLAAGSPWGRSSLARILTHRLRACGPLMSAYVPWEMPLAKAHGRSRKAGTRARTRSTGSTRKSSCS